MIDAIVTAGGKGTRIKDVAGEKPLIDVLGTPLIERVLGALRSSSAIDKIFVTVSQNTPMTKSFLEKEGVNVVMTSGDSYVDDLKTSMRSPTSDHVLVCPSDMPLLTSEGIDMVIERFYRAKVGSFSVTVPKDTVLSLGINPTYSTWIDGREVVLCGVSVVDKGRDAHQRRAWWRVIRWSTFPSSPSTLIRWVTSEGPNPC